MYVPVVWILPRLVSLVFDAVDPHLVDKAMRGDMYSGRGQEENRQRGKSWEVHVVEPQYCSTESSAIDTYSEKEKEKNVWGKLVKLIHLFVILTSIKL